MIAPRAVFTAKALKDKLNRLVPNGYEAFKISFLKWVSLGKPNPHWMFGRNKTEKDLSHVHLRPTLTDKRSRTNWKFHGTSDRNLFYVDSAAHGFLFLDIVGDPGAHEMWKPYRAAKIKDWTEVADSFCLGGVRGVQALMQRRLRVVQAHPQDAQ